MIGQLLSAASLIMSQWNLGVRIYERVYNDVTGPQHRPNAVSGHGKLAMNTAISIIVVMCDVCVMYVKRASALF